MLDSGQHHTQQEWACGVPMTDSAEKSILGALLTQRYLDAQEDIGPSGKPRGRLRFNDPFTVRTLDALQHDNQILGLALLDDFVADVQGPSFQVHPCERRRI